MAPRDELEHYEATEAQDLTRLLRALRPPEHEVQVPPPVDLAIRAAIWQAPVRRQLSTLLSMARWDLVRVIRQALTDNPLLEEEAPPEDEDTPAGGQFAPDLMAAAEDLTAAAERYDSVWQACVPDGWDAHGLPAQASEVLGVSAHPSGPPEALVPDVIVTKVGDDYQVVLNEEGMPRLHLRAIDRRLAREGPWGEPVVTHDLDDQLCAAVWLIRSLEYRRRTLSAVAQSLVTRQRAFLDHGPAHLQPLALTEVAAALGLHTSTVRRVVTNIHLATAHGIVALTSCVQSGLESAGGETRSSLTVKERIKQLVAAEDPAQPLTDQQLVEALAAEHVRIARRTVTQYRRGLQLPPAHRRQRISDVQVFCHACGTLRPIHGVPCRACGFVDPTPVVEIGTVAEKDTTRSMGPLASSDEEQRVRQALEAHTRRGLTEPLLGEREEASEVKHGQHHLGHRQFWCTKTDDDPGCRDVG